MHPNVPHTSYERDSLLAAAISGVLYVLLVFVPQVDGPAVETASADQIRSFLSSNGTALRALTTASAIAIPLVLVFTVALARLVRNRSAGSPLADLIVGGGVLVAMWHWLVIAVTSTTLVQSLDGTNLAAVDDATLRGWYGLGNFSHLFADLGMAAMATVMAATSIAALRTQLFPRWLGWFGLISATGGAIGTIGITTAWQPLSNIWLLGIFGWWAWSLATAVACALRLRQSGDNSTAEPPPTAQLT